MWLEKSDKWLRANLLGIAAIVTFSTTILLALEDKTASSTVMAGLFALTVLFMNFPNIESFKAWGVEAKLIRETLNEAKATLNQFQKLVDLSAQQTFSSLATQGRLSTPDIRATNALAIATMELMKESGIDLEKIDHASRPYAASVEHDIKSVWRECVYNLTWDHINQVTYRAGQLRRSIHPGRDDEKAEKEVAIAEVKAAEADKILARYRNPELSFEEISVIMEDSFKGELLTETERTKLIKVEAEIKPLFEASRVKGAYTPEAVDFIIKYGPFADAGWKKLMQKFS